MIVPVALILSLEVVSGRTPGWFGNLRGGHLSFSGAAALSSEYLADKKDEKKAIDVKSTTRIRGGHLSFSGAAALSNEYLTEKKEDKKVVNVKTGLLLHGPLSIRGGHLSFSGADALSNEYHADKKEDTVVVNVKSTSAPKKWSDSDFEEEDHFFHALMHNNDDKVVTNASSKKTEKFMPADYMRVNEAFRIYGGGQRRGSLRPRALSNVAYAYGHLADKHDDEEAINAKSTSKNPKNVSSKKVNVKPASAPKKWSNPDFEEEDHFFHALIHNNDDKVVTNVSSKRNERWTPDDSTAFDEAFRICGGGCL